MNLKRYIDVAVRRELRRRIDGYRNINRVVGKFYALLRAYKPADSQQKNAIEETMRRIRMIPDQMESDSGERKAFNSMFRIERILVGSGIYDGGSGSKISNLYGDLFLEMTDYGKSE